MILTCELSRRPCHRGGASGREVSVNGVEEREGLAVGRAQSRGVDGLIDGSQRAERPRSRRTENRRGRRVQQLPLAVEEVALEGSRVRVETFKFSCRRVDGGDVIIRRADACVRGTVHGIQVITVWIYLYTIWMYTIIKGFKTEVKHCTVRAFVYLVVTVIHCFIAAWTRASLI